MARYGSFTCCTILARSNTEAIFIHQNIPDRTALLKQAQHIVRSNCTAVANELNCEENADVEEIAIELNNEADDDDGCVHTDSESLIPWQNFAICLHQIDRSHIVQNLPRTKL